MHCGFRSVALTHIGHLRATNQDAFVERAELAPAMGLWAIADGMGGHRDGDVASAMVCSTLAALKPRPTLEATLLELQRRVNLINAKLYAAGVRSINPIQSGTTLVALLAQRAACAIVWAGDSRAYRLRRRCFTQLTTDHTLAAEYRSFGYLDEVVNHGITRAVGGEGVLRLDVRHEEIQPGDRYLLCSDGLTHELSDERIELLLQEGDVGRCAQALLDATLATSARDNVTVVVVETA